MSRQKEQVRAQRHREISFSNLDNSTARNSNQPTYEMRYSRGSASPLHNLHYKYLPDNYVSPQKSKNNCEHRPNHVRQLSSKTEGITKINSKIKNILESIEQEEKRKEVFVNRYSKEKANMTNNYPQKYQISHRNDFATPLRDKNMNVQTYSAKYSNMSSIKAEEKQNSIGRDYSYKLKQSNASSQRQSKLHSNSYNFMNSRYLNYSASRMKRSRLEDAVVIRGKNVDEEIDKIQMKIQELEAIKKNLKVDQTSQITNIQGATPTQSNLQFDSKMTEQTEEKQQSTDSLVVPQSSNIASIQKNEGMEVVVKVKESDGMVKSEFYNIKEKINEQDVKIPKILKNLTTKRKKANKQNTHPTEQAVLLQVESTVSQYFNTNTHTPQSMETGRQLNAQLKGSDVNAALCNFDKEQANQLKRLLVNMQKQIKVDEQLRKIKKWFQRVRNERKWLNLQKDLSKVGVNMNITLMKTAFSITSQEENPFYTPREEDFQIDDLVKTYQHAEQHWKNNIFQCYSRQKLKDALFVEENIDISKRGFISIEDLVRYINYEMDTFYRNRDLFLIYHRLKNRAILQFDNIIEALTKQ